MVRGRRAVRRGARVLSSVLRLGDGGALAFFKFAKQEDEDLFGPAMPATPFHHIALNVDQETQRAIEQRLAAAGYKEPQTFVLEHGYCRSVYGPTRTG